MISKKYISKFYSFIGNTSEEIIELLRININPKSKSLYSKLTKEILGELYLKELKSLGYIIKSVRLKTNQTPMEAISFPAFKYQNMMYTDWLESELFLQLNKKYLFIFYSQENYSVKLNCVKEWEIKKNDLEIAKNTWLIVKELIKNGNIVKEIRKGKRFTNFPKSSKQGIVHVRPHASNSNDTFRLPIIDKVTKLEYYTKHSFWLNKEFIKNKILLNE
jgi:hypothetical protein